MKSRIIRVKPKSFDTDWRTDLQDVGIKIPDVIPTLRYTPVNHDPIPFSMEIDLDTKRLVKMIYGVIPNATYRGKIYRWEEFCEMISAGNPSDN